MKTHGSNAKGERVYASYRELVNVRCSTGRHSKASEGAKRLFSEKRASVSLHTSLNTLHTLTKLNASRPPFLFTRSVRSALLSHMCMSILGESSKANVRAASRKQYMTILVS